MTDIESLEQAPAFLKALETTETAILRFPRFALVFSRFLRVVILGRELLLFVCGYGLDEKKDDGEAEESTKRTIFFSARCACF